MAFPFLSVTTHANCRRNCVLTCCAASLLSCCCFFKEHCGGCGGWGEKTISRSVPRDLENRLKTWGTHRRRQRHGSICRMQNTRQLHSNCRSLRWARSRKRSRSRATTNLDPTRHTESNPDHNFASFEQSLQDPERGQCFTSSTQRKFYLEETEKNLTSLEAAQAIASSTCGEVAADHETSADARA